MTSEIQAVFQDPYGSLNPVRTIGQTIAEPLIAHRRGRPAEVAAQVSAALERVGLPADAAGRYPGQFSGGQRQRIAVARARGTVRESGRAEQVCEHPRDPYTQALIAAAPLPDPAAQRARRRIRPTGTPSTRTPVEYR
jgi:ABC-type microcin C transport system duplicated ATPase subunit YejF